MALAATNIASKSSGHNDFGSGRSAARLARLLREQEVGSSNLPAPTTHPATASATVPVCGPARRQAVLWTAVFVGLIVTFSAIGPLNLAGGPADAAAGNAPLPATYAVRRGDNLSVVAKRFGTTVAALRSDNHLNGDVIQVGQELRLGHPFATASHAAINWDRPVRHPGPVLRPFGPYKAGGVLMPRTGAEVACQAGTRLYSPADGVVRHSGVMEGFGHLLIIEHAGRYATVLAPCDPATVVVKVGQAILRGDVLGQTAPPDEPGAEAFVHIELRRQDTAVSPDPLLK